MFLYSNTWAKLDMAHRIKIANKLGIPKTKSTHMFNNTILDDGFSMSEIEKAIDVPNLQKVLDTKEPDPMKLWLMLIHSLTPVTIQPKQNPEVKLADKIELKDAKPKTRGRPKKQV